jgi:hypothetical protein
MLFCASALLQVALAQENDSGEPSPAAGLTLGAAVTFSDLADKAVIGVRTDVILDKTLGSVHLFGKAYDKVLYDDQMDMRVTHFEEEIGYRFGVSRATGIGLFINNVNNIYIAPQAPSGTSAVEGVGEPGLKFDGAFSFGGLQVTLGIPVVYRQSWQAPDIEPVVGLRPKISWQSNIGLGLYGAFSFTFPPASNKELMSNEMPFERTEWKVSYMTGPFYMELYVYTTLDFKKVNISPTVTYFSGPFSLWLNLDMGQIGYQSDFAICPTTGVTYSF